MRSISSVPYQPLLQPGNFPDPISPVQLVESIFRWLSINVEHSTCSRYKVSFDLNRYLSIWCRDVAWCRPIWQRRSDLFLVPAIERELHGLVLYYGENHTKYGSQSVKDWKEEFLPQMVSILELPRVKRWNPLLQSFCQFGTVILHDTNPQSFFQTLNIVPWRHCEARLNRQQANNHIGYSLISRPETPDKGWQPEIGERRQYYLQQAIRNLPSNQLLRYQYSFPWRGIDWVFKCSTFVLPGATEAITLVADADPAQAAFWSDRVPASDSD